MANGEILSRWLRAFRRSTYSLINYNSTDSVFIYMREFWEVERGSSGKSRDTRSTSGLSFHLCDIT
nr:hypothetical protein Q903MT_gene2761 [Picea sitchensis]